MAKKCNEKMYVTGYARTSTGIGIVWGQSELGYARYINPMTLRAAERDIEEEFPDGGVIYKLVPVTVPAPKRKKSKARK